MDKFSDLKPRLVLTGITKRYPSVVANEDVSLRVRPGEIHAVLGENGAGKSTLMKIIYGVTKPDAGTIMWNGQYETIVAPSQARRMGIGMVFQHFSLFETLTVWENIALALDEPVPTARLAAQITRFPKNTDFRLIRIVLFTACPLVRAARRDRALPASGAQASDHGRATSVLTPQAVLILFKTLRRLASEGCSILYISHKLDEIRALCDTATVLRGGKVSGDAIPRNETNESLARLMIGGELAECHLTPREAKEVRLDVQHLSLQSPDPFGTSLKDISLQVRSGEILGIAGVSGNGQKELMTALSGERLSTSGSMIKLFGQPVGALNPAKRRALGLTFVPEERLGRGAVPPISLAYNALLTGARKGMVLNGMIHPGVMRTFSKHVIERFKVKCGGEQSVASSLSGGNLQKFIVGRETMLQPKMMIVAQPTWGVDVGAAQLIRQALIDLRDAGVAILVISEELDELFTISDRLSVLAAGAFRLRSSLPKHRSNKSGYG